jgi:hypothetical protein
MVDTSEYVLLICLLSLELYSLLLPFSEHLPPLVHVVIECPNVSPYDLEVLLIISVLPLVGGQVRL